jgi:hypothetical protein
LSGPLQDLIWLGMEGPPGEAHGSASGNHVCRALPGAWWLSTVCFRRWLDAQTGGLVNSGGMSAYLLQYLLVLSWPVLPGFNAGGCWLQCGPPGSGPRAAEEGGALSHRVLCCAMLCCVPGSMCCALPCPVPRAGLVHTDVPGVLCSAANDRCLYNKALSCVVLQWRMMLNCTPLHSPLCRTRTPSATPLCHPLRRATHGLRCMDWATCVTRGWAACFRRRGVSHGASGAL